MQEDIFTGEGITETETLSKDRLSKVLLKAPWVSRWRPKCVADTILPTRIKNMITYGLETNEMTHMILHSGKPGTGKTSTALAIPNQLNSDYLFFAGAESNSDIFDNIRAFASQKSMGKPRFIIIDEADRPKSQDAAKFYNGLNSLIEATEGTIRYILTCNNLYKIPESISSRCAPISFAYDMNDNEVKRQLFARMKQIAQVEVIEKGGTVNEDTLKDIARYYYPDFRSIIQSMFISFLENKGSINGEPTFITYDHIQTIWNLMISGDYMKLRQFISSTIVDFQSIYAPLGEMIIMNMDTRHRLNFAITLAEYQHRASIPAVDQEINMNGFVAKTMLLIQS